MKNESKISPVLCHLAWLAERINDPVNDGRAKDAALLVFNAAAMLQWRFVAPLSRSDMVWDDGHRAEAAEVIDHLVWSTQKIVSQAAHAKSAQDKSLRAKLTTQIRKVIKTLSRSLPITPPEPARLLELEASPNVRELLDELLQAHERKYAAVIAKGRHAAAKGSGGADAALNEAVAGLIYAHDPAREADTSPSLRRSLAQMSAGFFKTVIDIHPDDFAPAQRKRLLRLAETLVEDAAAS